MAVLAEESFDAPIPGMSLTHALGDRPWQQPSQFTTVDDAIEYYMARMTSEEFMMQLVDVLEMGVPVTTLANTIQLSNVMEGKHTVDVGMLVTPLLDPAGNKTSSTFFAKYLKKYGDKLQETDIDTLQEESQEPVEEADEEPKGLMARRK
jgi:hypothetical protein